MDIVFNDNVKVTYSRSKVKDTYWGFVAQPNMVVSDYIQE